MPFSQFSFSNLCSCYKSLTTTTLLYTKNQYFYILVPIGKLLFDSRFACFALASMDSGKAQNC